MQKEDAYYHAGTELSPDPTGIIWSLHTRRTVRAAEKEARKLARKHGGRPIVEAWSREHGLRPRDVEVVKDAWYVEETDGNDA